MFIQEEWGALASYDGPVVFGDPDGPLLLTKREAHWVLEIIEDPPPINERLQKALAMHDAIVGKSPVQQAVGQLPHNPDDKGDPADAESK